MCGAFAHAQIASVFPYRGNNKIKKRAGAEKQTLSVPAVVFINLCCAESGTDGAAARVGKIHPDLPWTEEELDPGFEKYIRDYDTDQRPVTLALLEKYADKEIIVFKSRREADKYLKKKEAKKVLLPR